MHTEQRAPGHSTDAGLGLVEVILAVLVITVALVALIPVQVQALGVVALGEQRQQAAGHAASALDRVRARAATTDGFAAVSQGRAPTGSDRRDVADTAGEPLLVPTATGPDPVLATRTCSEQSGCTTDPAAVTGLAFTTHLYVSRPSAPAPVAGLVTVTAVTAWTSQASGAPGPRTVVVRTRIATPGAP